MSRNLIAGASVLLALLLLSACGRSAEAPFAAANDAAELSEVLPADARQALDPPVFKGALDGEPYLAEAEQACILERDPISGAQQFVLSFERTPEDALILHIPLAEAGADTAIARAFLLQGERYLEAADQPLDDWTQALERDGWRLSGEFALDLVAPVAAADARTITNAEITSPPAASMKFRDGVFGNLYCLDLERLKALGGGPTPQPALN